MKTDLHGDTLVKCVMQEQLPDGKFRLSISIDELPERSIKVQIKEVTLVLSGPWVMEWTREPGN